MHSMASGFAFFTIIERRASLRGERLQIRRQRIIRLGEQMVGHERGEFLEPEMRNLREHLALARNAVGHDDVEGGDAVAGDEQQPVAEVEDFAHLAAAEFFDAGQVELENGFTFGICHAEIIQPGVQSSRLKVASVAGDDVRSLSRVF